MTNAFDDEYDIIAIGAGLAGLAAACTAVDHGLRPLVIEKSSLVGGVTAYSNGQLWAAGNHLATDAGIVDSTAAGYRYLIRLGMGFASSEMAQSYAALAPRAIKYFERIAGVRWQLIAGLADYYYPDFEDAVADGRYVEVEPLEGAQLGVARASLRTSPHVAYRLTSADIWKLGGAAASHRWDRQYLAEREQLDLLASGTGLAAYFIKALGDSDIITGAHVTELTSDTGRVTGVEVHADGRTRRLRARLGVLLATGGYDWNASVASAFEGQLDIHSAAPPAVTGDHLPLALPLGAAITHTPKPIRLGYPVPGASDEGRPLWRILGSFAFPHAILVNREGRRFADESFYPSIGHAVKAIDGRRQQFSNWPCWAIFDTEYRTRYTFGSTPPGEEFPAESNVISAATITELAVEAGIEPGGLEREVSRFNDYCAAGVDIDFSRGSRPWARTWYGDTHIDGNPNLGTIATPPFYAYRPGLVGTGICTLGLLADGHGRVLREDRTPIPGLYAAGNSAAITEAGAGYQSGVANTRSLVFAWAAVRHAADDPVTPAELQLG